THTARFGSASGIGGGNTAWSGTSSQTIGAQFSGMTETFNMTNTCHVPNIEGSGGGSGGASGSGSSGSSGGGNTRVNRWTGSRGQGPQPPPQ
ncbi:hypothetical protein KI387_044338, partial [Taxus chinensis]